jgi:hypothetical protein
MCNISRLQNPSRARRTFSLFFRAVVLGDGHILKASDSDSHFTIKIPALLSPLAGLNGRSLLMKLLSRGRRQRQRRVEMTRFIGEEKHNTQYHIKEVARCAICRVQNSRLFARDSFNCFREISFTFEMLRFSFGPARRHCTGAHLMHIPSLLLPPLFIRINEIILILWPHRLK